MAEQRRQGIGALPEGVRNADGSAESPNVPQSYGAKGA